LELYSVRLVRFDARLCYSRPARLSAALAIAAQTAQTIQRLTIRRRVSTSFRKGGISMSTALDILRLKGHTVYAVRPEDTVLAALGVMAKHDIGAVLVMQDEHIVGMLTERDYARKVVLAGRSSRDSPVGDIMTTQVVCVAPSRSIDECMGIMTERRVRHLPVVERKRVLGLISIGDLVKETIADQQYTITQLQRYIVGADYG
jgi:CBS domain-containing protein